MDIVNLIISLLSGVAGGNAAGAAMQEKSLGTAGNSITGLLGGGLGNFLLQALGVLGAGAGAAGAAASGAAPSGSEFDIAHLIGNIAGSGVGGGVLTVIVALLKEFLKK